MENNCLQKKYSNKYTEERNKKISISKTKSLDDFLYNFQSKYDIKHYSFFKEQYINRYTKMEVKCNIHNIIFKISPRDLLRGRNCRLCAKEIKHNKLASNTDAFIEKAKKIHGTRYDYSKVDYIDKITKVIIKCNVCGTEFTQRPDIHLSGSGCKECNKKSKGERRIEEFLKMNKIPFEFSKFFEDLKDVRYLTYDYYIDKYKLLIEYNGKQHYNKKSIFYKSEKNSFHRQLHHDWLKRKYARDNNYNYLVISYKEFNKIQDKIEETIKNIRS